jgi:hypothetical protein
MATSDVAPTYSKIGAPLPATNPSVRTDGVTANCLDLPQQDLF